jgi:hypothetical protein
MRTLGTMMVAALIGAAALAMSSAGAAARIVCNEEGDCWHVQTEYQYRPEHHVIIHPDDWRWKEGENYKWREHEGRGYWNHGTWNDF